MATAWSYGLALGGYVVFAARVAVGSRKSVRARLLLSALVATAVWAGLGLLLGQRPEPVTLLAAKAGDALRYGAWFLFLWHLLARPDGARAPLNASTRNAFVTVTALLVASILIDDGVPSAPAVASWERQANFVIHMGLAIFALVLVEQVVRRVQPQMRWSIKPLAVGLAAVFGLELFFYADALLFHKLDPDIWLSRGFANLIVIPFLAVATARNTGWTIDLHLSRGAVFHSTALLISGAFLLLVAGAGYFVRYFGGDWGKALQIEVLFAALLLVALIATSGRFRSRLKVFVSKHFFSYRYDYREEWLKFTRTLSMDVNVHNLQTRTIVALANLLESPAGALWLKEDTRGFVPATRWNMAPTDVIEPVGSPFVAFLERSGWIIDVAEHGRNPERYDNVAIPAWLALMPAAWLVIPLAIGSELLGFVVLTTPRAEIVVDWEVRDLLKTASRQAASYLGQARATEALLEARKFDAFNRMSAFVVHDLKNLVSQLSLMLRNAERHRDNPAFQSDMLTTVAHVVGRMNALMLQLRTGTEPVDKPGHVDLPGLLGRVCTAKADPRVPIELHADAPVMIVGHEDRLEHVIGHLLQNAVDACLPEGRVEIRVVANGRFATLRVTDSGRGMTGEFVRERLFKPFQTTKSSGMGIGVYESQQYLTSIGGSIRVDSQPGSGTCVEVMLPLSEVQPAGTVAAREAVA